MFDVDTINRSITMSIGDTGAVAFRAVGYDFTEDDPEDETVVGDRVLFTLKGPSGEIVMEKLCPLENNRFVIYFHNSDTDSLQPGTYTWDLRCIIHPYYDESGKVRDGDQISTPYQAMTLTLVSTVGTI